MDDFIKKEDEYHKEKIKAENKRLIKAILSVLVVLAGYILSIYLNHTVHPAVGAIALSGIWMNYRSK